MASNPKAGDIMSNSLVAVGTVKGDIENIAGTPLTFVGVDTDGIPLVEAVTTEGAGFELIGLYESETPGYYAAASDGAVFATQDGSISRPGYTLVGADGNGGIKEVSEGGRPVIVFMPAADSEGQLTLACIKF